RVGVVPGLRGARLQLLLDAVAQLRALLRVRDVLYDLARALRVVALVEALPDRLVVELVAHFGGGLRRGFEYGLDRPLLHQLLVSLPHVALRVEAALKGRSLLPERGGARGR